MPVTALTSTVRLPTSASCPSAERRVATRIVDVHVHVVAVGPDAQVRVVVVVVAQEEVVAVVAAGGVAGGRDRDALVGGHADARELADQPAAVELVVEDDRVAV